MVPPVLMENRRWTWLDSTLTLLGALSALAVLPVRLALIEPVLVRTLDLFRYSDARIPWLTRLAVSGYATWGGLAGSLSILAAALTVRLRVSASAGRVLLACVLVVSAGTISVDLAGVSEARHANPIDFGIPGISPCPCPAVLRCLPACVCGCNAAGQVAVQLFDRDLDLQFDSRCVYAPPCDRDRPCTPRCEAVHAASKGE